jgi:ABC-2 type transport system permease protein
MNVFHFELRRSWAGAAVWTLVILGLMAGLIVGALPVFLDSRANVEAMLSNFPPEFAAAFGLELDHIFSFGGFYSFGFLYYSLFGAIMTAVIGLDLFSREKREKCTDFLMSKPRSRDGLFLAKLLAALTLILLSNVLFIAESLALYRAYAPVPDAPARALLASSALLFTELVFFAIAVFAAVFAKKVRSFPAPQRRLGSGASFSARFRAFSKRKSCGMLRPLSTSTRRRRFSRARSTRPM